MRKYITKKFEKNHVDEDTGEIKNSTAYMEIVPVEVEPFFFTFSRQLMALYGKPVFNAATKILWKFQEYAEYNTGKVYMNSQRVNEIMQACNISKPSYYRAIKDLEEAGILKGDKSTYTINSNIFWKGDAKTRKELINNARLKVTFTPIYPDDEE